MTAEWAPAPRLLPPHYAVSRTGDVCNLWTSHILRPQRPAGRRIHPKVMCGRGQHLERGGRMEKHAPAPLMESVCAGSMRTLEQSADIAAARESES